MYSKQAIVAGLILAWISAAQGLNMETVPVGNPGNAGDTRYPDTSNGVYSFGAVCYTYNLGRYEVTAGQYTEFLNAVAKTDPYGLYNTAMWSNTYGCKIQRSGSSGNYSYSVAANWANRPVNYVSFWDAARFCNWMHNGQGNGDTETGSYINVGNQSTFARLPGATWVIPTEDEWYKAAYHKNDGMTGNYWDYPTGTNNVPSNQLVDPDPGNNSTFYSNSYTIGNPYYRTEVGAHENSDSPYGMFDQGGNVWEWNETVIKDPYRGLRGGSFVNNGSILHASNRTANYPTVEGSSVGFRVDYVPEPATLFVLAGGIPFLLKRKRKSRL